MIDKMKEKLIVRYEYLDFNDEATLKCFNSAIKAIEEVNPDAFKDSMAFIELEHFFISNLVKEVHNGNNDIYDALSIAFESRNDFFIRRKKDKVGSIDKKRQKELYDIAFRNAINQFIDGSNLQSLLISNLCMVYDYENEHHDKGDEDMKVKSIYDEFSTYDKELVSIMIESFKKRESSSYNLLIKRFGINFDGENITKYLSYAESSRIELIIKRMSSYLEFAESLLESGKNKKDIENIFTKKDDMQITEMMTEFKKGKKKPTFDTKEQIMTFYNISEKELDDALGFAKNMKAANTFKYAYGILTKRLNPKQTAQKMGIDMSAFVINISTIKRELESIIKDYKEYMEIYNENSNSKKEVTPEPVVEEVKEEVTLEPVVEEIKEEIIPEPVVEEVKEEITPEPVVEEVKEEIIPEPVVEEVKEEITPEPVVEEVKEEIIPEPVVEEIKEEITLELIAEEVVEAPIIKEIIEPIEEEKQEDIKEIKLNYIDSIILSLFNKQSIKNISRMLLIDEDEVINSLLRSFEASDRINEFIIYIVENYPHKIDMMLTKPYFEELFDNLTDIEKQIVYLKLKMNYAPEYANEIISEVTNIPVEEIKEYEIYSKEDKYNELNKIIRKLG